MGVAKLDLSCWLEQECGWSTNIMTGEPSCHKCPGVVVQNLDAGTEVFFHLLLVPICDITSIYSLVPGLGTEILGNLMLLTWQPY